MKVLIIALAIMLATPCFAEVVTVTPKIAYTYNLETDEQGEAIGGSVKEFKIRDRQSVDIDVLVGSEVGDTLKTDEKTIIAGVSYNYSITEDLKAGLGAGLSAIELSNGDLDIDGEDEYLYACISYKF